MSYPNCLRLKPLTVKFYSQTDCPPQASFSAIIQHGDTVYRSGVFRSHQEMTLQLMNLSWVQFPIAREDCNSFIHVCLVSLPEFNRFQQNQQNGKTIEFANNISKQYTSLLPIEELIQTPVNIKKRFSFPIMQQGQIKAEAEFKLVIKRYKRHTGEALLRQINLQQKVTKISQSRKVTQATKTEQKQQKSTFQPIMSETCIVITPEMFTKKLAFSLPQISSKFDSESDSHINGLHDDECIKSASFSSEMSWNQDDSNLLLKFEQLNAKFRQRQQKQNQYNSSVIDKQSEYSNPTLNKKISNFETYQYEVINEETESEESEG